MAKTAWTTRLLLEKEMKRRGWNQRQTAISLGVSATYIHEILKGKKTGEKSLFKFAEKLAIDLFEKTEVPKYHRKPIPVISWVHAGSFIEYVDSWPPGVSGVEGPVFSTIKTGPNAFGLKIEGDSMMPRFMPGDIAIVDPSIRCDNGRPCVVWINGDVSIKLFWDHEKEIILKSMNDKYPDIVIRKDSKTDFRIIGKVVDIKVKLR